MFRSQIDSDIPFKTTKWKLQNSKVIHYISQAAKKGYKEANWRMYFCYLKRLSFQNRENLPRAHSIKAASKKLKEGIFCLAHDYSQKYEFEHSFPLFHYLAKLGQPAGRFHYGDALFYEKEQKKSKRRNKADSFVRKRWRLFFFSHSQRMFCRWSLWISEK
jgi:hypothetical protein